MGEGGRPGVGGRGEKWQERRQKRRQNRFYDKNVFATIDNLKKNALPHVVLYTVFKNIEKMSSLDVFTQNPNTLSYLK